MEHNNEINETDVMILAVEKKNTSNSQTILAVFGMIAGSIPLTIIAPMPILSVLGMGVGTLSGGIAGIVVNEQMHPDNKKKNCKCLGWNDRYSYEVLERFQGDNFEIFW